MPPRTRTKVTKVLKENIGVVRKNKHKTEGKATKPPKKALADKTNTLSDDNASINIPIKTSKTILKTNDAGRNTDDSLRPRRNRRLPPRYVENQVLNKLSNSQNSPAKQSLVTSKSDTPVEKTTKKNPLLSNEVLPTGNKKQSIAHAPAVKVTDKLELPTKATTKDKKQLSKPAKSAVQKLVPSNVPSKEEQVTGTTRPKRNCRLQSALEKPASEDSNLNLSSPFKTPSTDLESSLVANKPKRICRLPSKFEDHSISPNKFIPVQPCFASTPINAKTGSKNTQNEKVGIITNSKNKSADKPIQKVPQLSIQTKKTKTNSSNSSLDTNSPDSNNNGRNKIVRDKKAAVKTKLKTKQVSPKANKITPFTKRLLDKSLSFRILDDKKKSNTKGDNLDIYEFTFDPNEEPPPQKKKRKRVVKKKQAKPKTVVLKCNYDDNMSKALANLKTKVKPSQTVQNKVKPTIIETHVKATTTEKVQTTKVIAKPVTKNNIPQSNNYSLEIAPAVPLVNKSAQNSIQEPNYASIRIEDIVADFEPCNPHDNLNYSPVNSPDRPPTPEVLPINESPMNPLLNKDPLNLQEDLSFFNEHPVASSSMNHSIRHPLASPWRVEFGNLPMKWHSNTYVKPNMTPAVECSFINSVEMNNKKHIYTNMVTDNEPLPEIESNAPTLKQTSIISFMREAAIKSENKKKRRRCPSPTKANSMFDEITNASNDFGCNTPKKAKKTAEVTTPNISNNSNDKSNEKESSNQSNNKSSSPAKQMKKKDKDCTYFGFDESENVDQENVSPVKNIPNTRTKGLRSRAVLQDFNAQVGPTRDVLAIAAKAKVTSSKAVEQLYDKLKPAEDVLQLPEQETGEKPADNMVANIDEPSGQKEDDDDSQLVNLFEDIEVFHHLKPHQKIYKAKKVMFQRNSESDSQSCAAPDPEDSSDDHLEDLTFHVPSVKQKKLKKKKPKKLLTKKEKDEVEAWAAGFNSMCEDIDEFPLVVE